MTHNGKEPTHHGPYSRPLMLPSFPPGSWGQCAWVYCPAAALESHFPVTETLSI